MIYSRWGCHVRITGYCGKHQPKGYSGPIVLVQAERRDPEKPDEPSETTFYFAQSLRADDGWKEIDAAVDAAPEIKLNPEELKAALKQAA